MLGGGGSPEEAAWTTGTQTLKKNLSLVCPLPMGGGAQRSNQQNPGMRPLVFTVRDRVAETCAAGAGRPCRGPARSLAGPRELRQGRVRAGLEGWWLAERHAQHGRAVVSRPLR